MSQTTDASREDALRILDHMRPGVDRAAWEDFLDSNGAWGKGGNSAFMHVSPDEIMRIAALSTPPTADNIK